MPWLKPDGQGASTWTLGLAKSDANLEVAKRENAVILYESDYKTRYAGLQSQLGRVLHHLRIHTETNTCHRVCTSPPSYKAFPPNLQTYRPGVHQAGFWY